MRGEEGTEGKKEWRQRKARRGGNETRRGEKKTWEERKWKEWKEEIRSSGKEESRRNEGQERKEGTEENNEIHGRVENMKKSRKMKGEEKEKRRGTLWLQVILIYFAGGSLSLPSALSRCTSSSTSSSTSINTLLPPYIKSWQTHI